MIRFAALVLLLLAIFVLAIATAADAGPFRRCGRAARRQAAFPASPGLQATPTYRAPSCAGGACYRPQGR